MEFHVSLAGRGDLSTRIYRQLHEAIVAGRLRPGERLPPTRDLARQLDVSRNTVALAYERLTAEGFLVGRVGAGTFVCANPPRSATGSNRSTGGIPPRQVWRSLVTSTMDPPAPPAYDFGAGVPDVRRFPMQEWRRQVARELRELPAAATSYGDPAGHAGLRAEIARHIGLSRSVLATPAEVLITNGAQQALDLTGRVLIDPGACVAVEEPGYPPARELFTSLGARVVGVEVDAEGIVVKAIPRSARLVYTTPSHQFPLGTPMSLARRAELLAWARRTGAVVIEDDYDSEFRFADRPLEPLYSLDNGDRVLYVGSFAKTMLPMLRLGFLVAPASLRPALAAAKQLTDRETERTTQGAMARFIADGMFVRHLRRSTKEYGARRTRILELLHREFADRLEVVPASAGMHLAAWLRPSTVEVPELVERAAEAGVKIESLGSYYAEGSGRPGLVLGYGAIALPDIEPGLTRLAKVWPTGPDAPGYG